MIFTPQQVRALPVTRQFMLMNTTKSGDFYADYEGVALWDLLRQIGISPDATSVSIFSADGFGTDFALAAYTRGGAPLDPGRLSQSGSRWVLDGEGPYRVVIPQAVPGAPDKASTAKDKDAQPFPYDDNADHNAGFSVRSAVAIRVNPLPPGTKDFDWREGGWNLVDAGKLVVYGALLR